MKSEPNASLDSQTFMFLVCCYLQRLEEVEAIVELEDYYWPMAYRSAENLKRMKKLRLLEVKEGFSSSEPTYFPEELRWLSWVKYPFNSLRITRDMTKLVGLEMTKGLMRQLQIGKKVPFLLIQVV